ncbi:MAG TPA: hypothetical protein VNZ48_10220 [Xanthobacteraceae bacterium]|nr:hypothetical protein [Xanthobacteraceae bacterium]
MKFLFSASRLRRFVGLRILHPIAGRGQHMKQFLDPLRAKVSVRFWVELVAGTLSTLMFVVTAVWPQWIEGVFGFDPDGGSGEAEWGLSAGLCAFTLLMFVAARREWKRAAITGSVS